MTTSRLSKYYGNEEARPVAVTPVAVDRTIGMPEFVKPFYKNGRVSLGWGYAGKNTENVRAWLKANGWTYHTSGRAYYPKGA
jgi:hypothetical protein